MNTSNFPTKPSVTKYSSRRWTIVSTPVLIPDGVQEWEQLRSKAPAVVVVPVNNDGKIGVISQNRVLSNGKCHIVWEFPSGWMESNSLAVTEDQIKDEANRELQEEIGFRAKKLEILNQFRLSNFAVVPFYVLFATELEENKLKSDEAEFVNAEWLTLAETEERLLSKQIPTAQVYVALQEYKRHLNSNIK